MEQKYNGIAPDLRSKKEKSKDFNAKELLVSGTYNTFRKVNSLSEVKKGAIRDQDGSNSCTAMAHAKALEMATGGEIVFTSTYTYQNRSNRNYPNASSGAVPAEICYFAYKNNNYKEEDVPSQRMNDTQIDNYKISPNSVKVSDYIANYFIDSNPKFEQIAVYVAQYNNTMLLIDTNFSGYYGLDIPKPTSRNHQIRHEVCVVDSINFNGVDYLVMDESWGIQGDSELAQRGQRLITKEAFYGMVEQAIVLTVSLKETGTVDYNKYSSLPKMEYRDRSKSVLDLQAMLKDSGYMPKDIATINYDSKGNSYGYYGDATSHAVLQWQLDNIKTSSQAQLKAWGGKYFGNASLLAIKNLSSAKVGENIGMENQDLEPLVETTSFLSFFNFKLKKYLSIVGSILVTFLATTDFNNIVWNKAGLIAFGAGLVQFVWQGLQKYLTQDKA